ncbi:hypothetical protein [Sphingobium bisphenolivorans]|uniref:hypothetical protein n=1 Tax=Sphingobium bisphenolivorans TaxID=1335760 RepID=UPI00039EA31B|nr:hypothetical protein [Sphingobium bisphenolivorans]
MKGELRVLSLAHGLLLGLVLALPMIAPPLLPWGVEALFILAAFQLRLADRRWEGRAGLRGWTSHIRMAPQRLAPWAAIAVMAVIAGPEQIKLAQATLIAVGIGELLLYPVGANLLGRLPRRGLAGVILLLMMGCALAEVGHPARLAMGFALGVSGCVFWLRGPDGESRSILLALTGALTASLCILLLPAVRPAAFPAALLCTVLTLAHLSVLRRRPLHWRLSSTG